MSLFSRLSSFNSPASASASASTSALATNAIHSGVECNGKISCWGKPLRGDRWKCLSCFDLDFCNECVQEHRDNPDTAHHILLCIPAQKALHPSAHALLTTLTVPLAYLSQAVDLRKEQSAEIVQRASERMHKGGDLGVEARQLKELSFHLLQEQHHRLLHSQRIDSNSMLQDKFFKIIGAGSEGVERTYQAYVPRYDCAVLTSEVDGRAIAAIQVIPTALARRTLSTNSSSPTPLSALWEVDSSSALPRFQSVFADSASNIPFAVIFTNLLPSQRLGMVLRVCSSVGTLLGNGLPTNSINVIAAGDSLIVDADSKGLALLLQEVKEMKINSTTGQPELFSVAFTEEQKRIRREQCGSYQKVEVFLVDERKPAPWLKNTRWAVSDVIVRHMSTIVQPWRPQVDLFGNRQPIRQSVPNPSPATMPPPPAAASSFFGVNASLTQVPANYRSFSIPSAPAPAPVPFSFPQASSSSALASSNVAQIVHGSRVDNFQAGVKVSGEFTVALQSCVLGFSIQQAALLTKLEEANYETIVNRVTDRLKMLRQAGWLSEKAAGWTAIERLKVFASEQCVVCLDGVPDCILLPCGHKCVHGNEANRLPTCPLCRKIVSARLAD